MRRLQTVSILGLLLAACTAQPATTPGGSTPSQAPTGTDAPSLTPEPTASPSPAPTFEGYPATGLALVQFPDPDSPASQVFVVEEDGTLRQVTGLGGDSIGASSPVWSPDRTQIAFGPPKIGFSGITGQTSVVNAGGSGERVLGEGWQQRWSPDGTRLLIHEKDDVTSEPTSIWIQDVATGEVTDLGQGFNAQWIDDERITFQRVVVLPDGAHSDELYIQVLDGSEPVQLPTEPMTEAVWSPDGSQVLLVHEASIVVADDDGSNPRDLAGGHSPVWSPDGTRVLLEYDVNQDALPLLALVDLDGAEVWSGAIGDAPTWSPDGTRIAVDIVYPEPLVQVLDAASGEVLWELPGASQPNWGS